VCYWDSDGFAIENYLTGRLTRVAPPVADLLHRFAQFQNRDEIRAACDGIRAVDDLIDSLIEQSLLVEENSAADAREQLIDAVWKWGIEARHFHYGTSSVAFECNDESVWEALQRRAAVEPPPSPFKNVYGTRIALPSPAQLATPLSSTLLRRRTCRAFTSAPLSVADLGTILWWTWGHTHYIADQDIGDIILKTSPSGGSRHPIEVYPVVLRATGIPQGIFYYSVREHALVSMASGDFSDALVAFCSGQKWVRDVSAAFIMTAVVGRTMWKYHHSHAYRVVHMDAGHLGQTFHLVCSALGLGPFTTAATNDRLIEQALGIDGVQEIPIYVGAVGKAAESAPVPPPTFPSPPSEEL